MSDLDALHQVVRKAGGPGFLVDHGPATAGGREVADAAMRAVYARCSHAAAAEAAAAFREGSRIEGDYQNYKRVFSNVAIHLARPEKADGQVLWYQVYFDKGAPVSFAATKDIAAEMCGLPGREIEVPL